MEFAFIAVLLVAGAIGAVIGVFKGYVKTSIWGGAVLIALLIERLVGGSLQRGGTGFFVGTLVAALATLAVTSILLTAFRNVMKSKINARRTLSSYENHDALEENEAYILNAVDNKNKSEYKKYRKQRRKIKEKSGVFGVLSRVFGGVFGAINGFVGALAILGFIILMLDLLQISGLSSLGIFSSGMWTNSLGTVVMDVVLLSVVSITIRSGYKSGISSLLCTIVIIGVIFGFAIGSYGLASGEAMAGMVSGLETGMLSKLPLGGMKHTVAVLITTVILFLLSLIVIILIAIFLPKGVEKLRQSAAFEAVDGVFGAIIFAVFIFALMMAFGGLAYTLNDLPVMAKVNEYMSKSFVADCTYSSNPLGSVFSNLPIRSLFGN